MERKVRASQRTDRPTDRPGTRHYVVWEMGPPWGGEQASCCGVNLHDFPGISYTV
jgi:hypothetical protein